MNIVHGTYWQCVEIQCQLELVEITVDNIGEYNGVCIRFHRPDGQLEAEFSSDISLEWMSITTGVEWDVKLYPPNAPHVWITFPVPRLGVTFNKLGWDELNGLLERSES